MSGGHAHGPTVLAGGGPLHRLPPQCKLAAGLLFVVAVVSTPRDQVWAFAVEAALLTTTAAVGRVPIGFVARRLVIELPFVAFAVLLPLVGNGPRVHVLGLHLSQHGLWAAWGILAKGTLGVATTVVLTATTPVPHLLTGLERLRVPRVLVAIMSFMVRYGEVVGGEMHRMRVARTSRGDDPRWIWQARALAQSSGALFVRSYERGERVYLAMESRGYVGTMPAGDRSPTGLAWPVCLVLPLAATVVSCAAWFAR